MKRLVIFLCVALIGFGGAMLQANRRHGHIHADVDVKDIAPVRASGSPKFDADSVRVVEIETIPLNYDSEYLGDFKFDRDGNIYFRASFPAKDEIGKSEIVRFSPASGEYKEIVPRSMANGKKMKSFILQGFDVDPSGNVYIATANPESVVIESSQDKPISNFALKDFLPVKISVDSSGRVWVGGDIILSSASHQLSTSQIRVYDPSGKLISVPVEGMTEGELFNGLFVHDGADSKFVSGIKLHTYDFREQKLSRTADYPFTSPSEKVSLLKKEADNSSPQQSDQGGFTRMLSGVSPVKGSLIWYGMLPDKNSGAFNQGFIALASASAQALTPEIVLPKEYGSPVGIDYQGVMYFLGKKDGQLVLRKAKLMTEGIAQ
jgi:hypothetical protein